MGLIFIFEYVYDICKRYMPETAYWNKLLNSICTHLYMVWSHILFII